MSTSTTTRGEDQILTELEYVLDEYNQSKENTIYELKEIVDKMDQLTRDVRISTLAGSTAGVVGGIVAGVGFVGSFFTFGLASPLMGVGAAIGAAGGITVAGATLTEYFKNGTLFESAQSSLNAFTQTFNEVATLLGELEKEENKLQAVKCVGNITKGTYTAASGITNATRGIKFLRFMAKMEARATALGVQGFKAGGMAARPLFQNIASVGGKALHFGSGALGLVLIPVDIYSIVTTSMDLSNGTPSDVSRIVSEMISDLENLP